MAPQSWIQRLGNRLGMPRLLRTMTYYPPLLGAGIRVVEVKDDLSSITIELKSAFATRNFMGTQYGGSIYSMCDPWLMLMLAGRLGTDYVVWDKAATVRFLKPGRSALRASFVITDADLERVRHELDTTGKSEPVFSVDVHDTNGVVVASVEKVIHAHKPSMRAAKR